MIHNNKTRKYISLGINHYKPDADSVTVFRLAKPHTSHEETEEETVESSAHRSRCVGMIALAFNALIAKQGLLVWS